MESLPIVFWTMYGLVFLFTFITSLVYWIKQRYSGLAAMGIILSLLIPLVSLVYTAQRNTGNEYQYMKEQLATWNGLAIALTIGYVFIVAWTIFVCVEGIRKLYHVPVIHKKCSPFFREKLYPLWHEWMNGIKRLITKKRAKEEFNATAKESEREVQ